MGMLTTPNCLF